jgi:hypothetical protein
MRQGAVYRLDDTILMNSRNRAAQEVTCIGLLYVTVADVTAQKEIEFKVKQTADSQSFLVLRFYGFESGVVIRNCLRHYRYPVEWAAVLRAAVRFEQGGRRWHVNPAAPSIPVPGRWNV